MADTQPDASAAQATAPPAPAPKAAKPAGAQAKKASALSPVVKAEQATKAEAKKAEAKVFTVLHAIFHNGEELAPGAVVSFPDHEADAAQALVDQKVLHPGDDQAAKDALASADSARAAAQAK